MTVIKQYCVIRHDCYKTIFLSAILLSNNTVFEHNTVLKQQSDNTVIKYCIIRQYCVIIQYSYQTILCYQTILLSNNTVLSDMSFIKQYCFIRQYCYHILFYLTILCYHTIVIQQYCVNRQYCLYQTTACYQIILSYQTILCYQTIKQLFLNGVVVFLSVVAFPRSAVPFTLQTREFSVTASQLSQHCYKLHVSKCIPPKFLTEYFCATQAESSRMFLSCEPPEPVWQRHLFALCSNTTFRLTLDGSVRSLKCPEVCSTCSSFINC
jgi:hypothetical protein